MIQVAPPSAPRRASRRAAWREAELVALDFEATGLDFARDTIVSFGTVPVRRGTIDLGGAVYQLVDPGEVPVSPVAVTVHMLRPVDLAGAPPLASAKEALRAAVDARFLLAWWAPVEAAFLAKLFGGGVRSWMRRLIDVRDLLIALEGTRGASSSLSAAARRYGVPVADPHHALDDALVTAQLFLVLATKLGDRARSIRDLRELRPRGAAGSR